MLRQAGKMEEIADDLEEEASDTTNITFYDFTEKGNVVVTSEDMDLSEEEILFGITISENSEYQLTIEASSELGNLAQLPVFLFIRLRFHNNYPHSCYRASIPSKTPFHPMPSK